jgi:hypothetical protein
LIIFEFAGIVGCADIPLDCSSQNTLIFALGLLASPTSLRKPFVKKREMVPLGLLASPTSLRIELAQSSHASKEIFYWEDSPQAFSKSPRCARVRPALRRNQASLLLLRYGLTVAFGEGLVV